MGLAKIEPKLVGTFDKDIKVRGKKIYRQLDGWVEEWEPRTGWVRTFEFPMNVQYHPPTEEWFYFTDESVIFIRDGVEVRERNLKDFLGAIPPYINVQSKAGKDIFVVYRCGDTYPSLVTYVGDHGALTTPRDGVVIWRGKIYSRPASGMFLGMYRGKALTLRGVRVYLGDECLHATYDDSPCLFEDSIIHRAASRLYSYHIDTRKGHRYIGEEFEASLKDATTIGYCNGRVILRNNEWCKIFV